MFKPGDVVIRTGKDDDYHGMKKGNEYVVTYVDVISHYMELKNMGVIGHLVFSNLRKMRQPKNGFLKLGTWLQLSLMMTGPIILGTTSLLRFLSQLRK